jgi:hypothetical protein
MTGVPLQRQAFEEGERQRNCYKQQKHSDMTGYSKKSLFLSRLIGTRLRQWGDQNLMACLLAEAQLQNDRRNESQVPYELNHGMLIRSIPMAGCA